MLGLRVLGPFSCIFSPRGRLTGLVVFSMTGFPSCPVLWPTSLRWCLFSLGTVYPLAFFFSYDLGWRQVLPSLLRSLLLLSLIPPFFLADALLQIFQVESRRVPGPKLFSAWPGTRVPFSLFPNTSRYAVLFKSSPSHYCSSFFVARRFIMGHLCGGLITSVLLLKASSPIPLRSPGVSFTSVLMPAAHSVSFFFSKAPVFPPRFSLVIPYCSTHSSPFEDSSANLPFAFGTLTPQHSASLAFANPHAWCYVQQSPQSKSLPFCPRQRSGPPKCKFSPRLCLQDPELSSL